jgi:hypothetical protein
MKAGIKGWRREKKMNLVKIKNPSLEFLNEKVFKGIDPFTGSASDEDCAMREIPPASG